MRPLLSFPILLLAAAAASAQNVPQDMEAYGVVHTAACKPTERKALKASLDALKEPDTQKLWQAIDTLLCAPATPANERYVKQMLASRVKTTDEGTGSEPDVQHQPPTAKLAREVMAKGQAWSAAIDSRAEGVVVRYAPDEACIASVTLTYRGKKWWISRAGSACD